MNQQEILESLQRLPEGATVEERARTGDEAAGAMEYRGAAGVTRPCCYRLRRSGSG